MSSLIDTPSAGASISKYVKFAYQVCHSLLRLLFVGMLAGCKLTGFFFLDFRIYAFLQAVEDLFCGWVRGMWERATIWRTYAVIWRRGRSH